MPQLFKIEWKEGIITDVFLLNLIRDYFKKVGCPLGPTSISIEEVIDVEEI